jgi:hypothetical protein
MTPLLREVMQTATTGQQERFETMDQPMITRGPPPPPFSSSTLASSSAGTAVLLSDNDNDSDWADHNDTDDDDDDDDGGEAPVILLARRGLPKKKTHTVAAIIMKPEQRARKNARARAHTAQLRQRLWEIAQKPSELCTDEEIAFMAVNEQRRSRRRHQMRELAVEQKAALERITCQPIKDRTQMESQFLETARSIRERKKEQDRLSRLRSKNLMICGGGWSNMTTTTDDNNNNNNNNATGGTKQKVHHLVDDDAESTAVVQDPAMELAGDDQAPDTAAKPHKQRRVRWSDAVDNDIMPIRSSLLEPSSFPQQHGLCLETLLPESVYGIAGKLHYLPTSPSMTLVAKQSQHQIGMLKRSRSPNHLAVIGQKERSPKKIKTFSIGGDVAELPPTTTVAQSKPYSNNKQQQQPHSKACNFVDLSLDDPSDTEDDGWGTLSLSRCSGGGGAATAATEPMLCRHHSAVVVVAADSTEPAPPPPNQQRVVINAIHSPEMQFINLIAQKLTGRSQQIFKAIAARTIQRHNDGRCYEDTAYQGNLPQAIWCNVRTMMDPADYMAAYNMARTEWTKDRPVTTQSANPLSDQDHQRQHCSTPSPVPMNRLFSPGHPANGPTSDRSFYPA